MLGRCKETTSPEALGNQAGRSLGESLGDGETGDQSCVQCGIETYLSIDSWEARKKGPSFAAFASAHGVIMAITMADGKALLGHHRM